MKSIISIALAAAFAIAIVGCGQSAKDSSSASSEPSPKSVETPKATGNGKAAELVAFRNDKGELVCPVTGDKIASEKEASSYQDYNGKRYYFCCNMCGPMFKANPEKYKNGAPKGSSMKDVGK